MPWSLRLCRCLERRCTEGRLIYRQSGRLCVLGHAPEHKGNKGTTDVLRKPDKLISYRHFDPAQPAETGKQDDLNYRVWRVSGDIKAQFDLHDFPFDSQSLLVRFQNREAPREQIAYVI